MGSLKSLVAQTWQDRTLVALSTPATYGAGAQNILAISGGPVLIKGIIEYNVTAMAGATTTTIAVGGIGMDVGALSIEGGIGAMSVSPLNVAVAKLVSVGVVTTPLPSLLGAAASTFGVVAAPGNITVTFAGVAMGAAELYRLIVLYQKLYPASLIS